MHKWYCINVQREGFVSSFPFLGLIKYVKSQLWVCLFWATVQTWWCNTVETSWKKLRSVFWLQKAHSEATKQMIPSQKKLLADTWNSSPKLETHYDTCGSWLIPYCSLYFLRCQSQINRKGQWGGHLCSRWQVVEQQVSLNKMQLIFFNNRLAAVQQRLTAGHAGEVSKKTACLWM